MKEGIWNSNIIYSTVLLKLYKSEGMHGIEFYCMIKPGYVLFKARVGVFYQI